MLVQARADYTRRELSGSGGVRKVHAISPDEARAVSPDSIAMLVAGGTMAEAPAGAREAGAGD